MESIAKQKAEGIGNSGGAIPNLMEKTLAFGRSWRLRLVVGLIGITIWTGLGLLLPPVNSLWSIFANVLLVHALAGLVLMPFLLIGFSHGRTNLKALNKVHRISGFLLMVTILLALVSGMFMLLTSGVYLPWVLVLHRWSGILALPLVVQHCRRRRGLKS